MHATYPSWRYHATLPPRLISGSHEEAEGWVDSPAAVGREAFLPQGLTGTPMQFTAGTRSAEPPASPAAFTPMAPAAPAETVAPRRARKTARKTAK